MGGTLEPRVARHRFQVHVRAQRDLFRHLDKRSGFRGFRVWGLGFGGHGLWFRVWVGVWGFGFWVDSVWLMVWGSWFRVKGLGLRVQVCVRAQRDIFRHREDTKGPSRFIPFAVSEP